MDRFEASIGVIRAQYCLKTARFVNAKAYLALSIDLVQSREELPIFE
jgi:hypothetical protein